MRALVVHAHPDPTSFNHVLMNTVVSSLSERGHDVDVIDLYAEQFEAALSESERRAYSGTQPILSDSVARHTELLRSCDILVFVYPTWWWGMPAIMKGWLDRVLVPGVAFTLGGRRPQPMLRHITCLIGVTTYGASRLRVALFNDAGRRTVHRTIRMLTNRRTRRIWLAMYGIESASDEERTAFVARLKDRLDSV